MVMRPNTPPFLLMTPGQQVRALEALGVEWLYDIPFDLDLSAFSDEAFAREVLVQGLGVRHVAAGFNVRFGKARKGDTDALMRYGRDLGFGVTIVDPVAGPDGAQYSSSAAREAIGRGDVAAAARILAATARAVAGLSEEVHGPFGRGAVESLDVDAEAARIAADVVEGQQPPFAIEGVVEQGAQLGRQLGFPTANVALGDYVRPALGVYATRTRLADGRLVPGVASVGTNPTVGVVEPRLEVWLFDFDEDLYGQVIETELVAYLRPEAKFDSLQALTAQVRADADQARALLLPAF